MVPLLLLLMGQQRAWSSPDLSSPSVTREGRGGRKRREGISVRAINLVLPSTSHESRVVSQSPRLFLPFFGILFDGGICRFRPISFFAHWALCCSLGILMLFFVLDQEGTWALLQIWWSERRFCLCSVMERSWLVFFFLLRWFACEWTYPIGTRWMNQTYFTKRSTLIKKVMSWTLRSRKIEVRVVLPSRCWGVVLFQGSFTAVIAV